ncbi:MAG: hypothetical protein CM1200mP10_20980 [Candidatus Neomarinimicrobiota bacterium]|nr:MAG: hypothetical protein CM1200mP10_20980 [Candidatus Neomarinimicrobiota bacterium]
MLWILCALNTDLKYSISSTFKHYQIETNDYVHPSKRTFNLFEDARTIPLRKLITRAKDLHMSHIALTEVNGLWGFIRFVQLAKEQGIKPIAGTNLVTTMNDIILLVENQTGYENMCRIISRVHNIQCINLKSTQATVQWPVYFGPSEQCAAIIS